MVNKNILERKLEFIDKHLMRVEQHRRISLPALLEDQSMQDVVEYNLFQTINHLIALMEHIVVDEGYGMPQSAYDGAQLLKVKRILTAADCDVMRQMIGFRNVIGHDYIHLDKKIVYRVLIKGTKDIRRIAAKLLKKFR